MSFINKLKQRWSIQSGAQVLLILLVFACTGFTVLFIKKPLFQLWFPDGYKPSWASILYWILILPVYNLFLLCYGFIFGQFSFFWAFEKKMLARLTSIFKK